MDNVQNVNTCINIPPLRTFRSYPQWKIAPTSLELRWRWNEGQQIQPRRCEFTYYARNEIAHQGPWIYLHSSSSNMEWDVFSHCSTLIRNKYLFIWEFNHSVIQMALTAEDVMNLIYFAKRVHTTADITRLNFTILWVVTPCSLITPSTLKMVTAGPSEMSVTAYETSRSHPQSSSVHVSVAGIDTD
jgi:hypothetical protein